MNCLVFENKQSFLDRVESMSDEEIILERKSIISFYERTKFDYNMFRSNLYSKYIYKAKQLLSSKDRDSYPKEFKELLEETFAYADLTLSEFNACEYVDDPNYEDYLNDIDIKESINIISEVYDQIICDDESGCINMFENLLHMIKNTCAIMLYKLYKETLIDEEYLKGFSSTPKVLFGGFDENEKPDYTYNIQKFIERIVSSIDSVEEA